MTGSDYYDKVLATELSEISLKDIKGKYTWHHLDDYDPITNTCTMQLVEMNIHRACSSHIGAVEIVKNVYPEANLYSNR
ncbi:HNH endonuclease [Flavobacterium azooxidireducens]|uniref:HNH endonuclease n=1 Tax=Flavobacterium azooxidireducens TaxID=1871076 RepID=A0ABY4KC26_9FLAO|nr:HNH endonuclease [Flavobacterium azooxidireducens]UPQ78119.1 HNH endonuclease [Flavobacterium azooxidireducens]